MVQSLRELGLEVDYCREIFAAIEKITCRSFEVVVADWDDGPEASFLLKTARELKYNAETFAIAIAEPSLCNEAARHSPNLVLSKPLSPEQIKTALLTCDEFLSHMRSWLERQSLAPPAPSPEASAGPAEPVSTRDRVGEVPPLEAESAPSEKASLLARDLISGGPALIPAGISLQGSGIQQLFYSEPSSPRPTHRTETSRTTIVRRAALGLAFLSAVYLVIHPARSAAVARSVSSVCGHALQSTHMWFDRGDSLGPESPEAAQNETAPSLARRHPARIRVFAVPDPEKPSPATPGAAVTPVPGPAAYSEAPSQPANPAPVRIPESLKAPYGVSMVRSVASKITPSLLSTLEPASLSEDLAQTLLLDRVNPLYPDQAVKNRLQGPVVFQAWIGRDGKIEELKLVRGYIVLAQAAANAVKQWRYRPYLLNGKAVEAQTYVTVDFKLP
jgi:TonB family protein